jgi:hypothetical protein
VLPVLRPFGFRLGALTPLANLRRFFISLFIF